MYLAPVCPVDAGQVRQRAFSLESAEKRGAGHLGFSGHYNPSACQLHHLRGKDGPVNSTQYELFRRYGSGPPDKMLEVEVRALPSVQGRAVDYYPVCLCCQPADVIGRKPLSPRVEQNYGVPVLLQEGCKVEHIKGGPGGGYIAGSAFFHPMMDLSAGFSTMPLMSGTSAVFHELPGQPSHHGCWKKIEVVVLFEGLPPPTDPFSAPC